MFLTINKSTLQTNFDYDDYGILLQNPNFSNNKLIFDPEPEAIGSRFILSKQSLNFNDDLFTKDQANLYSNSDSITENSVLIILCHLNQLMELLKNYPSSTKIKFVSSSTDSNEKQVRDEYVILLIVTKQKTKQNKSNGDMVEHNFNTNVTKLLKLWKEPNLNSSNGKKHNGTFGKYYGFGIINKYHNKDGISFGGFQKWKTDNEEKRKKLQNLIYPIFKKTSSVLNTKLPSILKKGNLFIKSLINFGRKNSKNNRFIKTSMPFSIKNDAYYSFWVCENARTEKFHQECDASYTFISVPVNDNNNHIENISKYQFQFRWNHIHDSNYKGINIHLREGICVYYNGFGLFHRQIPLYDNFENDTFWNFSMYHNKRLFNCINQSIDR